MRIDMRISEAIKQIIQDSGQISLIELSDKLQLSKRTLERNFYKETGLLPKQFARIIQFQASLRQLRTKEYNKLSDIVYSNGYADQSHFIHVFKSFTGLTPKEYVKMGF